MHCNERLEHNDPGLALCALYEQVGELWYGHVGLVGALQQICDEKQRSLSTITPCTARILLTEHETKKVVVS